MKVDCKTIAPCRTRMIVKAEADETRADFDEIIGYYLKGSRIPGFRIGKAPLAAVEQHYRKEIDADVRSRLVGKFSRLALTEAKIEMVSIVNLSDVIQSPATGISFVLVVDVAPEFKLPKYRKLPLKSEEVTVSEDVVDGQVMRLRNALSQYVESAGRAIEDGDLACVDYTAVSKGKPLKELAAECAALGEAEKRWVQVSEPEFIPGLVPALKGMKAGESKTVAVTFAKDFHVEAVRGVKAEYSLKVDAVRQRVPPSDEDICKRLGVESLELLRARIREESLAAARARELGRQRQEIIDLLIRKTDFALPQLQVDAETQHTLQGMVQHILQQGGKREDIEKNRESLLEAAAKAATDRVRARYILTRIAAEEKIEVTAAEEQAFIEDLARRQRVTPEEMRADIEKRHGGLDVLRADIRAEKALDWVIADAKNK